MTQLAILVFNVYYYFEKAVLNIFYSSHFEESGLCESVETDLYTDTSQAVIVNLLELSSQNGRAHGEA